MKQIEIKTCLSVYESLEELPEDIRQLMREAVKARGNAYAPYSKFKVGAAVLLENEEIITGNNQENAAYPSGLCAERVAIFYAGATHPGVKIKRMALTASSENQILLTPTPPCGSCRQAMAEYELSQEDPIEIFFMGEKGKVVKADSVKCLLPFVFDNTYL